MMTEVCRSVADVCRVFGLDSNEVRVAEDYFYSGGQAIAFALPFDPSSPARRDVTKEALDFVADNEWGGHEYVDGVLVRKCLDCGAFEGQEHSPTTCRWLSVMQLGGRR